MISPDPTWLQIPEADQLRALAGTTLSVALVVCVATIALSAIAWAAHRVGLHRMGHEALAHLGRAALAAAVLGALSGIVGWSSGLI